MKKRNKLPHQDQFRAQLPVNLRTLRLNAGLPQKTLAQLLCISRSTYSYYETGSTEPSVATLYWLSRFYNVPADVFFTPGAAADLHPDAQLIREHCKSAGLSPEG